MLTMTHNYNNTGASCSPSTFRLIKYSPMLSYSNVKTAQWNRLWKFPEFNSTAEDTEAQRGQGVRPRLHSGSVLEPNTQYGLFLFQIQCSLRPSGRASILKSKSKKLHSRSKTYRWDTKINARGQCKNRAKHLPTEGIGSQEGKVNVGGNYRKTSQI